MRYAVSAVLLFGLLALRLSADVITFADTASATVTQTGQISISAGFFGGLKDAHWTTDPNPNGGGAGYNYQDWHLSFPVNLPTGSTVNSAVLTWSAGTESFNISTQIARIDYPYGGCYLSCDPSYFAVENPG